MRKAVCALMLIGGMAIAVPADASIVFTFGDVSFDIGSGTASGTFTIDDDLLEVTDWSLVTSAGTYFNELGSPIPVAGNTYTTGGFGALDLPSSQVVFDAADNTRLVLQINFSDLAKPVLSSVQEYPDYHTFRTNSFYLNAPVHSSYVAPSSSVSGVPEPATWTMMLLGFALVGFGIRYRRVATSVAFA